MSFADEWQSKLNASYAEFAPLVAAAPDIDLKHGILGTAILWPIRARLDEDDAYDALFDLCGRSANRILKAVRQWGNDQEVAARSLAEQARADDRLQEGLLALIDHFEASDAFAQHLAQHSDGNVYHVNEQIKAALVNVGGVTNIQSLTVQQVSLSGSSPAAKPIVPPLPFEPETILIPAGPFLMGTPAGDQVPVEETPQHKITLAAYRLGKFPVTNEQYLEFVRQTGTLVSAKTGWTLAGIGKTPPPEQVSHPIRGVSWDEAWAYCRWLSEQSDRCYRLPTEAEWEKAARGPDDDRFYPWGLSWDSQRCNHEGSDTTPVDHYEPQSVYQCYDLAGNVWEWTSTRWGLERAEPEHAYPYQTDGRETLAASQPYREYRICRGGSFGNEASRFRCSARARYGADSQRRQIGFRVVLEV